MAQRRKWRSCSSRILKRGHLRPTPISNSSNAEGAYRRRLLKSSSRERLGQQPARPDDPPTSGVQIVRRRSDIRHVLRGDAAHIWLAFAGYGMNAGSADAMNLSWMLAGVINDWADPMLLDVYELERRPITAQVSHYDIILARLKQFSVVPKLLVARQNLVRPGTPANCTGWAWAPPID
jgi:2-polyprenyl-6-methoxyphenol hydroxylase-like FAD-dependent oxidoreductase